MCTLHVVASAVNEVCFWHVTDTVSAAMRVKREGGQDESTAMGKVQKFTKLVISTNFFSK